MSDIWKRVTKQDPCPVCQKGDWCQIGDFVVKCMRVESAKPCPSGGWYHVREGVKSQKPPTPAPRERDRPHVNCFAMIRGWRAGTFVWQLEQLAESLGVLTEAVTAMGACWSTTHNAWAFPMFDEWGEVVGIRLRANDGSKWSVSGGKQGVFVPMQAVQIPEDKTAWLVEGPTDCAAALSIGLYPIGRPSCNSDAAIVRGTLRRLGITRAVIVGERDKIDPKTGKRPGISGAAKLKADLRSVPTVFWIPPAKDLREMVRLGGTKADVDSAIKNIVWKRG